MVQELISMSNKELSKYKVINNLINKQINGTEASKQLNLTVRQIKNLKVKVIKDGVKGLIHGNRGKRGNRKMKDYLLEKAVSCLKERYYDFGPKFACEKLSANHNIKLSKEKVRQIMIGEQLWKARARKTNKEYRSWRPRKEQEGEMIQFDGSYHKWFEDRAGEYCLLAAIDDATGKITDLVFDHNEGVIPVFKFWKAYLEKRGKPIQIYLDKFSTYKINHKSAIDNKDLITQFERANKDLGIRMIRANSPQAKGRIERLFRTLQDRLVKELRLVNISDIPAANRFVKEKFIPEYNKMFAVIPQKKGDLHRELNNNDKINMDRIFSIQDTRIVNNDFTISFKNKWLQLDQTQPVLVLKKSKVLVEERIDGSIFLSLRDKYLNFKELPERPKKIIDIKLPALASTIPSWKPPIDHPWRKPFILNYGRYPASTQSQEPSQGAL